LAFGLWLVLQERRPIPLRVKLVQEIPALGWLGMRRLRLRPLHLLRHLSPCVCGAIIYPIKEGAVAKPLEILNIPEFRTTFVSQKWTRLKA
jgi:hypothetical protein